MGSRVALMRSMVPRLSIRTAMSFSNVCISCAAMCGSIFRTGWCADGYLSSGVTSRASLFHTRMARMDSTAALGDCALIISTSLSSPSTAMSAAVAARLIFRAQYSAKCFASASIVSTSSAPRKPTTCSNGNLSRRNTDLTPTPKATHQRTSSSACDGAMGPMDTMALSQSEYDLKIMAPHAARQSQYLTAARAMRNTSMNPTVVNMSVYIRSNSSRS
mmetsp:Transcript_1419/g.5821  ORF Transcript_1419/g.5821 Transcript_1419/m.5821 type:complete len:218 (-) Transcript_1419:472-1125(-)